MMSGRPSSRGVPPRPRLEARDNADNAGNRRPKKPRRKNRWFTAIVMVLGTLVGCVFLSVFILDSAQDLFGLNQPDKIIEITVPKGATNKQVVDILTEQGIITKNLTFLIYSGLKVEEGEFVSGNYILNSNMGYDEIIVALRSGDTKKEVVRIQFIEGSTIQDFAQKLEEERVCPADEFIEYLNTASNLEYEFVDMLPEDPLRFRRLEGYIFPDTYDFYVNEKVASVAKKFLDNFERKITSEMENRMRNLGLTLDQTITLASIIQKEAGDPSEMKMVSAVFHNRLDDSITYPNLQSDVTIFYANTIKRLIDMQNQSMYDAYNTYECDGLPVGPISNPGFAAIEAALYPADTEDLFFVTDTNGVYYYATTPQEHYANVNFARAQKSIVEGEDEVEIHGTGVQG